MLFHVACSPGLLALAIVVVTGCQPNAAGTTAVTEQAVTISGIGKQVRFAMP
jgi:hypothetical protein